MYKLLSPLSLPQRLLGKLIYPPALGILLVALLAIWTIGMLIESKTAAIEFTRTTSNATVEWTVNSTALQSITAQFVKVQKHEIQNHVTSYLTAHVYPYCHRAVESWNQSLSTSIHAQNIMYDYMLDMNHTITNVLYDKSKQINESLSALNRPDASKLSLNFWFVGELFHNASTNNTKLKNLRLNFPLISNSTKLNLPDISIDPLVSKISNISKQRPERINAIAKLQDREFSTSLRRHCEVLTAITVTTYIICVLGICFYEWLKFKWETAIFNDHIDLYFHPLEKAEDVGPINSQQRLRQFFRELIFTMDNTLTYWLSNWFGARKVKENKTWNRLMASQWWIGSITGYFLLIITATVIHWQICLSIFNIHSKQLTAIGQSQHQGVNTSINNGANTQFLFLNQFSQECHNFERHILETLNKSIFTQLWSHNGTITTTLNNVNVQMNKLSNDVEVASPPQWNNLTLSQLVFPTLAPNNPNSSTASNPLNLQLLKGKAVSRHRETKFTTDKNLLKITNVQEEQSTVKLHMWTVIGLVVTMVMLYVFGLTVFIRL